MKKHRTALEMFQLVSLLCKRHFTKYRKTPLFVALKRYLLARERAEAGTFHLLDLLGNSKLLSALSLSPQKEAGLGNSSSAAHEPPLTSLEKGKERAADVFTCDLTAVTRLWKSGAILSLCSTR